MKRKRVKPRLFWLGCGTYLVAMAVAVFLALALVISLGGIDDSPGGNGCRWILVYVLPVVALWLILLACRALLIRLGLMTQEEARGFPFRTSRWPDSWLESIDQHEEAGETEKRTEPNGSP